MFCRTCTSHSTPLLDATTLPFVYPPRGTPIATYASPTSPVLPARVCDACYAQIHGTTPTHSPSPSSSSTSSALSSTSTTSRPPPPRRSRTLPAPPPPDPSLPDDLRNYPLRIRSDICKATGGGRWTPKPSPIPDYMKRVPGRKAPYELAVEEEEAAVRRALSNPVIRDGGTSFRVTRTARNTKLIILTDFQYRSPRPLQPSMPERPLEFSTF